MSLKRRVRCFPKAKPGHPSYYQMHGAAHVDIFMVGLLSVIDCLYFFFVLTTKMHNYLFFVCCLLESGNHV